MIAVAVLSLVAVLSSHVLAAESTNQRRVERRQVSLDDLIHTALQIVKPIFDTSQPLVDSGSPIIPKKVSADAQSPSVMHRESDILGAPAYSSLREVPICRGNSQICKFISCTAHNFKHDQNFANLNLAAQLINDKKFRRVVSRNPEAISTVCHEQGLSPEQCRLFSRGFQLIDRLMTTIEKTEDVKSDVKDSDDSSKLPSFSPPDNDESSKPSVNYSEPDEEQVFRPLNDVDAPPPTTTFTSIRPVNHFVATPSAATVPVSSNGRGGFRGSRTWSTHRNEEGSWLNDSHSDEPADSVVVRPKRINSTDIRAKPCSANNKYASHSPPRTTPRAEIPRRNSVSKATPQATVASRPYTTYTTQQSLQTLSNRRSPRREASAEVPIPETEEYEDNSGEEESNERAKRSPAASQDYYDEVVTKEQMSAHPSVQEARRNSSGVAGKPSDLRINCLQYLG